MPILPPGATGPERWDNPVPLGDGSWIIAAYPGRPVPKGGSVISASGHAPWMPDERGRERRCHDDAIPLL